MPPTLPSTPSQETLLNGLATTLSLELKEQASGSLLGTGIRVPSSGCWDSLEESPIESGGFPLEPYYTTTTSQFALSLSARSSSLDGPLSLFRFFLSLPVTLPAVSRPSPRLSISFCELRVMF